LIDDFKEDPEMFGEIVEQYGYIKRIEEFGHTPEKLSEARSASKLSEKSGGSSPECDCEAENSENNENEMKDDSSKRLDNFRVKMNEAYDKVDEKTKELIQGPTLSLAQVDSLNTFENAANFVKTISKSQTIPKESELSKITLAEQCLIVNEIEKKLNGIK
jgi:hypothetical protein